LRSPIPGEASGNFCPHPWPTVPFPKNAQARISAAESARTKQTSRDFIFRCLLVVI
jgi:hypothetical protein